MYIGKVRVITPFLPLSLTKQIQSNKTRMDIYTVIMVQIYHKCINVTTLCSYNESKTTVTEKWMMCCVKLLSFCCLTYP